MAQEEHAPCAPAHNGRGPAVPEGGFDLRPYQSWDRSRAYVDADDLVTSLAQIVQGIVYVEGPVVLQRVNAICVSLVCRSRSREAAMRLCEDAVLQAETEGRICRSIFEIEGDWTQTVLHRPGGLGVAPRERGPRESLYEIPLPELGVHMRKMRNLMTGGGTRSLRLTGRNEDDFLRRAAQTYGTQKLTRRVRLYLGAAKRASRTLEPGLRTAPRSASPQAGTPPGRAS